MPIQYQLMVVQSDGRILCAGNVDVTQNSNWNPATMEVVFPESHLPYDLTFNIVYWDSENLSYVLGETIPQVDPMAAFWDAPKTTDKVLRMSSERMEGSRLTLVTPNWCDKRTWYYNAEKKTAQVLDHISNYNVYRSPTANAIWIDNYHGLYSDEDRLTTKDGDVPRLVVYVNEEEVIEQDPHYAHFYGNGHWSDSRAYDIWEGCFYDGKAWKCIQPHTNQTPSEGAYWTELTGSKARDFSVDYTTGTVYFRIPLTENDEVTVDTWEADGSMWIIKPIVGKKIKILDSEVQFSEDIIILDTVKFQAWGKVDTFAPSLTPDPYPSGTYIPLAEPVVYKSMMDYINEANGAYPEIQGGDKHPHWRNLHKDILVLPFKYQAVTEVTQDMEIRVWLEHEDVLGGFMATATFYCMSYSVT